MFVLSQFLFGIPGNRVVDVFVIIPFLVFVMGLGHVSGTCIEGVFLVSDRLRLWFRHASIGTKENLMNEIGDRDGFGRPIKKKTPFDELF